MDPKELKGIVDGMNANVETLKKLAEGASKEVKDGIAALEAKIAAIVPGVEQKQVEEIAAALEAKIQKQIDELATEQKGRNNESKGGKNFVTALKDALSAKKSEIEMIVKNGGKQTGPLVLDVKAAVTIGIDNTILDAGSASHYTLTYNTGIISRIRKRVLQYLQNVSVGQMDPARPYAMWIEELDEQGNPIFIGEGDAKTQLSVRYEEREAKAKKIAVYSKVTTEMLKYLPQLISYIQNNLMRRVDIKTEDQLFNGDNTGDNLNGVMNYATAFDGGGLAGTIPFANTYDVLRAVVLQVAKGFGMASGVFVNPTTVAQMELSKDEQGRYLLPPFIREDGRVIAGMRVIETNALGDDEFVGGELEVINVYFTEGMTIQIGLDGNDFTNNKKTILVEQQLVQFVSANDTQVLVKGEFTTAIALLTAA